MTKLATLLLAAAPLAILAAPVHAQAGNTGIADLRGAIFATKAMQAANAQIRTQYKTQLDQADARTKAIQAELNPQIQQFNAAQAAPNASQQSLQTQAQAIQAKQQAGEQEIGRITLPAQRAEAYAASQVQTKLNDAVQTVMRARGVTVLLAPNPQVILSAQPAADLTPAITTELDRTVPSVSIAVPANWQPGQDQAGAAPATAPATTTPPARPAGRNGGR